MLYSFQVGLAFLLLVDPTAYCGSNSDVTETGQDIGRLVDKVNEFVRSSKPMNYLMDIFVNPECLKENAALFKTILDSQGQAVTLWTDVKKHYEFFNANDRSMGRQTFSRILYFICETYDVTHLLPGRSVDYVMNDVVVAENAKISGQNPHKQFRLLFMPPYPRTTGIHVLSFVNGSMFLTSEFGKYLVRDLSDSKGLPLERRRMLSGSNIDLSCFGGYECVHPDLSVTTQLLKLRNASVSVHNCSTFYGHRMFLSSFVKSMGRPGKDFGSHFNVVREFGSVGFSFYVRKRDRVAKETIFILPFSPSVWIGILASSLLLVLTHGLIWKVLLTREVNLFAFIFPMMAAFFQQSVYIHSSLLKTQSSRLLYGLTAVMAVVLSTAFKGRLISLLNDLPFQGEVIQFESFRDLSRKGLRLCILEDPTIVSPVTADNVDNYYHDTVSGDEGCHKLWTEIGGNRSPISMPTAGSDTFFTYNSRTGPSEALRRELLERGYVETEGVAFSHPVGPETWSSSVYRHDMRITLSRGIQAGLYSRAAALAEYKSRSLHKGNPENTERLILSLSDLRPFFLAWSLGIFLSILLFSGEMILSRVPWRKCKGRARMLLRQRARYRIRIAPAIRKISSSLSPSVN